MKHYLGPADLAGVLLLVHHGAAELRGVVLHGELVPLLDVVGHLAVGVEHCGGETHPTLVNTPVCPVTRPEANRTTYYTTVI